MWYRRRFDDSGTYCAVVLAAADATALAVAL